MQNRFAGQVVVVTGAAKGIGAVIAQHFAEQGSRLVIADVDEAQLAETGERLAAFGYEKPLTRSGDLSQEEAAGRLVEDPVSAYGPTDMLANNAGGGIIKPSLEHAPETLRTSIDRNLWTTLWG